MTVRRDVDLSFTLAIARPTRHDMTYASLLNSAEARQTFVKLGTFVQSGADKNVRLLATDITRRNQHSQECKDPRRQRFLIGAF